MIGSESSEEIIYRYWGKAKRPLEVDYCANVLTDEEILEGNLVETVSHLQENLWKEISKQKVVCLKPKEVNRLLQTVELANNPRSIRDLAIFSLLFESGISIGVLVSLNLSDINLRRAS